MAANTANQKSIVKKGGILLLVKLMGIGDNRETECAINAVWAMVANETLASIQQTPELSNVSVTFVLAVVKALINAIK